MHPAHHMEKQRRELCHSWDMKSQWLYRCFDVPSENLTTWDTLYGMRRSHGASHLAVLSTISVFAAPWIVNTGVQGQGGFIIHTKAVLQMLCESCLGNPKCSHKYSYTWTKHNSRVSSSKCSNTDNMYTVETERFKLMDKSDLHGDDGRLGEGLQPQCALFLFEAVQAPLVPGAA